MTEDQIAWIRENLSIDVRISTDRWNGDETHNIEVTLYLGNEILSCSSDCITVREQ